MRPLFSVFSLVVAGWWSAVLSTNAQVNVTQEHNNLSRDGLYIDAAFTPLIATEPTKEKSVSLPPPVSDKTYTFEQIEKQKAELKDKVVRIEIMKLVAGPGDRLGKGTQRYIVEDTSKGATPYGQVDFPREGLEKMGLVNDPHREGPFTVYARVHVFAEKKAAAICVAVGTRVAVENGKATYSW